MGHNLLAAGSHWRADLAGACTPYPSYGRARSEGKRTISAGRIGAGRRGPITISFREFDALQVSGAPATGPKARRAVALFRAAKASACHRPRAGPRCSLANSALLKGCGLPSGRNETGDPGAPATTRSDKRTAWARDHAHGAPGIHRHSPAAPVERLGFELGNVDTVEAAHV